ncbi:restriction endonuclease subunit S [Pseudohalioglobus sediminis]|uniref:Restriction endonuclease subunit S n=1 Tax=Pseudohalioglobus sediminis TaxID=2606449 RepID=A0A5B0WS28_9GAMM|nr:restriction endonuclease subunit S [Pseudohalioglobus sediminis]KAA1189258.1 restriction endonuclease subunit S [Pseudohalioglobus sediminis]
MSQRYSSFAAYKDSSSDWLGKIPDHWQEMRLGTLFKRVKETNHPRAELLSVYRDHGVVPKSSRDDNFNKASEDLSSYQLVRKGDLVLNKMKTWQGSIAISDYEGIVSPAYFTYRSKPKIVDKIAHPQFLHYLLRSGNYISQYLRCSKGIRVNQWDLDPDLFKVLSVLIPPLDEQRRIAAFLDHETAKVDTLIAKQERLIQLLEEKRQAVISHAIERREGDRMARLAHFINLLPGYAFKSQTFSKNPNDTPLLRGINVGVGSTKWDETVNFSGESRAVQEFFLEAGDIVLGMDRPWIKEGARVAKIAASDLPCLLVQRVARLRAINGLDQDFLLLALKSNEFRSYIESDLTGVSVPHLSPEQIKGFRIPVIDRDEQKRRVTQVKTVTTKIDLTVQKSRKSIALLSERRASVISAAVTGKIDTRDWKPYNV